MSGGKFEPELFFQRPDNVALRAPASELFGFMKRSLDLPGQWAALIARTTGDHVLVRAGGVVAADDVEDVLFVRVTPVEVSTEHDSVVTRDRFACRASVQLRLSVIPERGELLSFQKEVLGSHRVVQVSGLSRFLEPIVVSGLTNFAANHDAEALVGGSLTAELTEAVTKAIEGACFTAGMVLEGEPRVTLESDTLRKVRAVQADASARRAQHEATAQVQQALRQAQQQHFDHLTGLLSRLNELADRSPDVALPELMRTFSEKQRGELYEALFASEQATSQTQWIVVAAGEELLFYDPKRTDQPVRRLDCDGSAGPVRSIRTECGDGGEMVFWLGAATGVYRWPIDRAEPDLTLLVDPVPSVRGGFNAVAVVGEHVFASHSEIGLCTWHVGEPSAARPLFESMTGGATAVREVRFFAGDVYCAIDDRVIRFPADGMADCPTHIYTGNVATITALCPTADGLFVGNSDGDCLHWPSDRDSNPKRLHTGLGRAAESVWLVDTHGVKRLIYADTSLHIHARVLGDSFVCRYEAGGQTLRRVEVVPDMLVATNDLRDRLIIWTPGEPAKPKSVIFVSRGTGRSVQDVCLVT